MDITIQEIKNGREIEDVLRECANDFYNQIYNNADVIIDLARKFLEYAYFEVAMSNNNTCCGFVAYYANDYFTLNAFVSMIVVKKEFQKLGIGKRLLEQVINRSKYFGLKSLSLKVDKTNENAINFYINRGFQIVEDRDASYIMKLKLKEE